MASRKILERAQNAATIYIQKKTSRRSEIRSENIATSSPIEELTSKLSFHSAVVDDLDDYKLEVSFEKDPECVLHTKYISDRARGIRRVSVVQTWRPQKPALGAGMFGSVRLETCQDSTGEVEHRAVKKLRKMHLDRMKIDFRKELIALTKFSRQKVIDNKSRHPASLQLDVSIFSSCLGALFFDKMVPTELVLDCRVLLTLHTVFPMRNICRLPWMVRGRR
jgi:hypothetical protein